VVVTGFKELPNFGDKFEEVSDEKTARRIALLNAQAEANESANTNVTSSDLLRMMHTADNTKTFNVIVKGDVQGSVTSVVDSLRLIDTQGEITLNIVSTGVGAVSENDIYMASGGNTIIYGFNVTVPNAIAKMAERNGVPVRVFRVIYELLDDAKKEMEGMLDAEIVETDTGELEVQGVFRTEKTEIIAGGQVKSGRVSAGMLGRVYRKKELLGEIEVTNTQEGKVNVPSLAEGEIGGLSLKTEKKIQLEIGDRIKFFTREAKKKTLA
jgi:translation initiation factor IF-2